MKKIVLISLFIFLLIGCEKQSYNDIQLQQNDTFVPHLNGNIHLVVYNQCEWAGVIINNVTALNYSNLEYVNGSNFTYKVKQGDTICFNSCNCANDEMYIYFRYYKN